MGLLDLSEAQVARNANGDPIAGARRYVYLADSDVLAPLYGSPALADRDTIANPMIADDTGWFETCFLSDGMYRVVIKSAHEKLLLESGSFEIKSIVSNAVVREFNTLAELLEDKILSYETLAGRIQVRAGTYITVADQNFTYRIEDAATVDAHLTTQGGVKMCVLVGEHGRYNADAFGVDRTGETDTSAALKLFYDVCIANNKDGILPAGVYLVTPGVLAFDNGHVDTTLPFFHTSGYHSTVFRAATNADAAFLSFTNGTASGPAGRYWIGGGHGGLRFERPSTLGGGPMPNQYGIVLRGVHGAKFDGFFGVDLGGGVVCIPRALYQGYNPDPYHVFCTFDYVEATRCGGYAFLNDNYVGYSGSSIGVLRAIECGGVFWGIGAGNKIGTISAGSCSGWAVGDPLDALGGGSSRFQLEIAEIDDCEYGFQCGRLSTADFGSVRFVHRYEFSVKNQGTDEYWPRTAIDIGAHATFNIAANIIHRVEAGGPRTALGSFADFNSAGGNATDIRLNTELLDNANFGLDSGDMLDNFNNNTRARYLVKSQPPVVDNMDSTACLVRGAAAMAVQNGGFSGAQVLVWPTVLNDPAGLYDTTDGSYCCPFDGMFNVRAAIVLTPNSIGERVRMGVAADASIISGHYHYATHTNPTVFNLDFTIFGFRGQKITIVADQNSGTAKNLTALISSNENHFAITAVK